MKKFLPALLSLAAAGAAGTAMLYKLIFELYSVNAVYYETIMRPGYSTPWYIYPAGMLFALAWPLMKSAYWRERVISAEKICRPLLLLWFVPLTFPWIILTGVIFAWPVFTALSVYDLKKTEITRQRAALITAAMSIVSVSWGYYIQRHAYDSLYFIYGDWNQYAEHYRMLAQNGGSFFQWLAGCGHWNAGVNILMSFLIRCADTPDTIFLVNSLLIASAVPLSYLLLRRSGISRGPSLLTSAAIFLNPALSHQFLTLFYGFHPIAFFIPVIFGFFICRAKNQRWAMALFFLLSLLIQETVAIFWMGYALYMLTEKKWKKSLLLFCSMAIFFLAVSNFIVPRGAPLETGTYAQTFHFSHLGGNMTEIILSPFCRPAIFWGTLFDSASFSFILAVLIPFAFTAFFAPEYLLAGIPLAAGICLQKNPEMKTILLQYGIELTVLAAVAATAGLKKLSSRGKFTRIKFLLCGANGKFTPAAAAAAILVSTLFSTFLYGFIPGGKERAGVIMNRKSAGKLISFIRDAAGEDPGRVITTSRLRSRLQFEYPVCGTDSSFRPGDILVFNLDDSSMDSSDKLNLIRKQLIDDPRAVPVTYALFDNETYVVFKILSQAVPPVQLPFLSKPGEAEFAGYGKSIPGVPPAYEIRYYRDKDMNVCHLRLKRKCTEDLAIGVAYREADDSEKHFRLRFAYGTVPAFAVPAGTVFTFTFKSRPLKGLFFDIAPR